MTQAEVIKLFAELVHRSGGVRAYARDSGINMATVSRVLSGYQRPSAAILDKLGLIEQISYVKIRKEKA